MSHLNLNLKMRYILNKKQLHRFPHKFPFASNLKKLFFFSFFKAHTKKSFLIVFKRFSWMNLYRILTGIGENWMRKDNSEALKCRKLIPITISKFIHANHDTLLVHMREREREREKKKERKSTERERKRCTRHRSHPQAFFHSVQSFDNDYLWPLLPH